MAEDKADGGGFKSNIDAHQNRPRPWNTKMCLQQFRHIRSYDGNAITWPNTDSDQRRSQTFAALM
ncbi:hypothetical protein D3C85_1935140 [compost metagenome]